MATTIEELVVVLRGEIGDLKKSLKEAAEETKQKTGMMTRAFEVFSGSLAADVVYDALGKLKDATIGLAKTLITDGVKAAQEQQDAINGLNQALIASGKYTEGTSQRLQDYAGALQNSSKFADDAILKATSLISSLGRLDEDGLKRATQSTLDLAAALGMDLQTAAALVGKAVNGNVTAINRYGIAIEEGKTKGETFANALKALNARFGGAAESQIRTYSGSVALMQNAWGDALEEIGNVIVKNQSLVNIFGVVQSIINSVTEELKANGDAYRDLVSRGLVLAVDAMGLIVTAAEKSYIGFLRIEQGIVAIEQRFTMFKVFTEGLDGVSEATKANVEEFNRLGSEIDRIKSGESAFATLHESVSKLRDAAESGIGKIADESSRATDSMMGAASATTVLTTEQSKLREEAQKLIEQSDDKAEKLQQEIDLIRDAESQKLILKTEAMDAIEERELALEEFEIEQNAKEIERLMTQNELMRSLDDEKYAADIAANQSRIDAMMNQEIIGSDKLLKLDADAKKKKDDADKKFRDATIGASASFFNNMMTLSRGSSKELFMIAKAGALATAIVQGALAVQAALANPPGPPYSIPQAIAAGAQAAVNISTIASTGFARGTDMVPGMGRGDIVPAFLEPKERVVPRRTNAYLEDMIMDYRAMKAKDVTPFGGGGNIVVELRPAPGMMDWIESQLIERGRLSTSLTASDA